MDGCEKGRSTGEVRYLYKLVFNMSTPVVTKTKITIPAGIEVYLTYKDRYLGGVPVTKPGTYIVEVYPQMNIMSILGTKNTIVPYEYTMAWSMMAG